MGGLQNLPDGTQSFKLLRKKNEVYVDKTAMIYELTKGRGKIFLSRPRRFGKTLLVSIFASLFKYGMRDFHGLAIEKLWDDTTYEVLQLDFSTFTAFDSVERFESNFRSMLQVRFGRLGFKPSGNPALFMAEFADWMFDFEDGDIVLLIDEYDAPLAKVINDEKLFLGIQNIMSEFFNILKSNEGAFRFIFLTGITRYNNTSIFSGFNNLNDISMDPDYGTLLGYTEEELVHYFGDYLKKGSEILNISVEELLGQMREYYDGFSFDEKGSTHVYCPWSVLKFFKKFEFDNYWFMSSGQPQVLMHFLARRKLEKPLDFFETVAMDVMQLKTSAPYSQLDTNVLLQQTGYYTIRSVDEGGVLRLGYPNREVESSMARLYAREMVSNQSFTPQPILTALLRGDVDEVMALVNRAFHALNYQNYPIRDEASFQAFMQVLMIGLCLNPQVEVHTSKGRSDMELEAGDNYWVFEFKYAKSGKDPKALCKAAADQIREKDYGNTLHSGRLIRVGIVFDEKRRQITDWKVV